MVSGFCTPLYVKEIYPSHILNTVLRKMVELLPSFWYLRNWIVLQELTLMHHTSCLCFSMQTGGQCEYEVRRDWRGQREGSLWLTAWDKTSSWILNTRSHEKVAWFNRWRTNWEQLCLRWLNKSRKAARHTHTFLVIEENHKKLRQHYISITY